MATEAEKLRTLEAKEKAKRDGAKAMEEYRAQQNAFLAKGDKLRALRLAREAEQPVKEKTTRKKAN